MAHETRPHCIFITISLELRVHVYSHKREMRNAIKENLSLYFISFFFKYSFTMEEALSPNRRECEHVKDHEISSYATANVALSVLTLSKRLHWSKNGSILNKL